MSTGRTRLEWNQTAEIWALLAEQMRDPDQRDEPFTAADIHPLLRKEQPEDEDDDGPDWALWSKITANVTVHTIHLDKLRHGNQCE